SSGRKSPGCRAERLQVGAGTTSPARKSPGAWGGAPIHGAVGAKPPQTEVAGTPFLLIRKMLRRRFDGNLLHDDLLAGHVGRGDGVYDVHPLKHLSKDAVLVIQPGGAADLLILLDD